MFIISECSTHTRQNCSTVSAEQNTYWHPTLLIGSTYGLPASTNCLYYSVIGVRRLAVSPLCSELDSLELATGHSAGRSDTFLWYQTLNTDDPQPTATVKAGKHAADGQCRRKFQAWSEKFSFLSLLAYTAHYRLNAIIIDLRSTMTLQFIRRQSNDLTMPLVFAAVLNAFQFSAMSRPA